MNPYDKTAAEIKRQSEGPKRFAKTSAKIGGEAALLYATASFAPTLARAAPFLSEYIPEDLAIKGLTKIHPKLGAFVKKAMDTGHDFSEAKDFIGKQIQESQNQEEISTETTKNAKEHRNIIEQYSPELFQFLDQEVKKGKSLWTAGNEAVKNSKFSSIIKKMMKDHKVPWTAILETAFGNFRSGQPSQQQEAPQQGMNQQQGQPQQRQDPLRQALITGDIEAIKLEMNLNDKQAQALLRRFIQNSPQEQNQGGIDPQLQSIIQQGNEIMKRFRG